MTKTIKWATNTSGDWANAANWSGGMLPNSAENVVIKTATVQTITHNSGNDVINALTVGNDHFVMNGGSLEILTTATFADGYQQYGGSLLAGTVTIHKSGILNGGSATGTTVLNISGPISLANYTLAGGAVLNNVNVTSQTGQITVGDATGVNATINNAAGGIYQIGGDYGITGGAASAGFVNTGLLAKINGSGTSVFGINITNTGTISANAGGNLDFVGPNNTIGGVLSGGGQIEFGGSSNTTLTVGTITLGALALGDAARLHLGGSTVLNGNFIDAASFANTTLDLGANTLTVNGNFATGAVQGTDYLTGSGSLVLAGTATLATLVLGGSLTTTNQGTVNQTGGITLGDSSGGLARIVNAAGATYDITGDVGIGLGSNTAAAFINNGLLEKSASNGVSTISAVVTNQTGGTIDVATGGLAFNNDLSNSGTISGGGHLELTGGSTSFAAGTVLSVAEIDLINAAGLTLGTSLSYAGAFVDSASFGQTVLALGNNVLTLTGASNSFSAVQGSALVTGTGKLASSGVLGVGQLVLGSSVTLSNSGTVNQGGFITIGDASAQAATILNTTKGVWNLTAATTIANGTATASQFRNFGTFNVEAGSGNAATITTNFTNAAGASINVVSGALDSNGTLINSGTISGTDLVLFNGSQTTLNTGTSLTVSQLDLFNTASLTLGADISYGGSLVDSASFGSTTVNLAGHMLSLSGPADFFGLQGNSVITGAGTLALHGATQIANLIVGGTSVFSNDGSITATGNLQIGDGSSSAATVSNLAAGIYDLTNDSGIGVGSSMASSFINAGLFEKTGGTGVSLVHGSFVNNGTITVTSGTVEFLAGTLVNHGTINGMMSTDQNGNIFITHS